MDIFFTFIFSIKCTVVSGVVTKYVIQAKTNKQVGSWRRRHNHTVSQAAKRVMTLRHTHECTYESLLKCVKKWKLNNRCAHGMLLSYHKRC